MSPEENEPSGDAPADIWRAYGQAQRRRADKLSVEVQSARQQLPRLRKEITRKNRVHRYYKQKIQDLEEEIDDVKRALDECQSPTFNSLLRQLWERVRTGRVFER